MGDINLKILYFIQHVKLNYISTWEWDLQTPLGDGFSILSLIWRKIGTLDYGMCKNDKSYFFRTRPDFDFTTAWVTLIDLIANKYLGSYY